MKETGAENVDSSGAYLIHIFIFKFMLSKHLLYLFLFISYALHMFIWEWFLALETILLIAYGTIYFYYNGTKLVFIFLVQNCQIKTCLNDKINQYSNKQSMSLLSLPVSSF